MVRSTQQAYIQHQFTIYKYEGNGRVIILLPYNNLQSFHSLQPIMQHGMLCHQQFFLLDLHRILDTFKATKGICAEQDRKPNNITIGVK